MIEIDMNLPTTCEQCRFFDGINYDGKWCLARMSKVYGDIDIMRDITCPMRETEGGEWIIGKYRRTCSKCRSTYKNEDGIMHYCPWCGTKMKEVPV